MFSRVLERYGSRSQWKKAMPYDHWEFPGGSLDEERIREWLENL